MNSIITRVNRTRLGCANDTSAIETNERYYRSRNNVIFEVYFIVLKTIKFSLSFKLKSYMADRRFTFATFHVESETREPGGQLVNTVTCISRKHTKIV